MNHKLSNQCLVDTKLNYLVHADIVLRELICRELLTILDTGLISNFIWLD